MGFRQALDPAMLGRYASAGTYTKPQKIRPDSSAVPLTLEMPAPGYYLEAKHQSTDALNVRLGNNAAGSDSAGVLVLHGSGSGLGPSGGAWTFGVDTALSPLYTHAFWGKINTDGSVRDVQFLWHNGASPAQVDIFPTGVAPTAGMTISGQTNAQADPPLLELRNPASLIGNSFQLRYANETQPRFAVDGNGAHKFGVGSATAPGGLLGATGVTAEFDSTTGWRVSRGGASAGVAQVMQVHNSRTPKATGDGPRLSFGMDGTEVARVDTTYSAALPSGTMALVVKTGASTFAERFRADANGVSFFGGATVGQSAAAAAVVTTAATQTTPWGYATQAQADAIVTLVNNLRAEIRALGLLT